MVWGADLSPCMRTLALSKLYKNVYELVYELNGMQAVV